MGTRLANDIVLMNEGFDILSSLHPLKFECRVIKEYCTLHSSLDSVRLN